MRVAAFHLVAHPIANVFQVEYALLFIEMDEKEHHEEEVTQFVGHFLHLVCPDGRRRFVSLFHKVDLNTRGGLLAVPGAPPLPPKPVDDVPDIAHFIPALTWFLDAAHAPVVSPSWGGRCRTLWSFRSCQRCLKVFCFSSKSFCRLCGATFSSTCAAF